jgi:DnaJ-class molecular chaperone
LVTSCYNCFNMGEILCKRCSGTGKVVNVIGGPLALGTSSWSAQCPVCLGKGKIKCQICNGEGQVSPRVSGELCDKCHGKGKVRCSSYMCLGKGYWIEPTGMIRCGMCRGTGKMKCDDCKGAGHYK